MLNLRRLRSTVRRAEEILAVWLLALMVATLLAPPAVTLGGGAKKVPTAVFEVANWRVPLNDDEKALQLLDRITFGPRPGDLERIRQRGLNAYLEEQLHPERIDDSAVEAKVAALPTLQMNSEELVENYPAPKPAPAKAERGQGTEHPNGLVRKTPGAMEAAKPAMTATKPAPMTGPQRVITELAQEEVLRSVYSQRQLQEVMVQFWMNHFNIFAFKGADRWLTTSFERDTIRPRALGKFEDLLAATAKSSAMLFYLDNWLSASPDSYPQQHPERHRARATRPAYGPFGYPRRGPFGVARPRRPMPEGARKPQKINRRGLNENYARELMELHTLGVDGGYTQKDVIEVARCLTGWTIDRPQQGGGFVFKPPMHDFGKKIVLGHKIKGGHGMEDGIEVLHILARSPATAHFISLKLCRRFVSDDPPPEFVDQVAKTFLKSGGDVRGVLKTILTSPEFYSQAAFRSKVKSPLELVASSLRASDGQTDAGLPLIQMIARMGQPMFQYQAPTGFPDRASTWINPGALLTRINFAAGLAGNRIPGTQVSWPAAAGSDGNADEGAVLDDLARRLTGEALNPETRAAILEKAGKGIPKAGQTLEPREVATLAGLVLASPEFQRR